MEWRTRYDHSIAMRFYCSPCVSDVDGVYVRAVMYVRRELFRLDDCSRLDAVATAE